MIKYYTVYKHVAPNGKMYVGVTRTNPKHRWNNGQGYKGQSRFFNAIKKYGWENFKHEILLEGLTKEEAELAERLFIGYWNLTSQEYGYNIDGGGSLNKDVSETTRQKMSQSHKGCKNYMYGKCHSQDTKDKISRANKGRHSGVDNPRYGKHHTKEAKLKMSMANKGKVIPPDMREKISIALGKRVAAINIDSNEVVSIYNSTREAERQMGIPHTNIGECCRGVRKTAGGYKWKYIAKER